MERSISIACCLQNTSQIQQPTMYSISKIPFTVFLQIDENLKCLKFWKNTISTVKDNQEIYERDYASLQFYIVNKKCIQ